ncbi:MULTISPECIES: hypothetical protein [Streptomyces]|uniref:hypothetical protein n=1 Tax=Streptomyces TaxID=1883 RepID=UPI001F36C06E
MRKLHQAWSRNASVAAPRALALSGVASLQRAEAAMACQVSRSERMRWSTVEMAAVRRAWTACS